MKASWNQIATRINFAASTKGHSNQGIRRLCQALSRSTVRPTTRPTSTAVIKCKLDSTQLGSHSSYQQNESHAQCKKETIQLAKVVSTYPKVVGLEAVHLWSRAHLEGYWKIKWTKFSYQRIDHTVRHCHPVAEEVRSHKVEVAIIGGTRCLLETWEEHVE